jgi:hypothetical protein
MRRGLGTAGAEVRRRLRQARRRLAIVELAAVRDANGNRLTSPAAYRALLRAIHMLACRGLVVRGWRRLGRDRRPRLAVWLPGTAASPSRSATSAVVNGCSGRASSQMACQRVFSLPSGHPR